MAGFFLWQHDNRINAKEVKSEFEKLGYNPGKEIKLDVWNVLIFPKKQYDIKNWYKCDNDFIGGVGTFGYNGRFYDKALPIIYEDYKNNKLDLSLFWGGFIILIYVNDNLLILRDGAGLNRLYSSNDHRVLSTSFAALISCQEKKFTFDRLSAVELLSTGVLTGNNTILHEIKRINVEDEINNIKILVSSAKIYNAPMTKKEALYQQLSISKQFMRTFINDWENYISDGIIDIGMTGGMDSRLLALLTLESSSKVVAHTHWRKEEIMNRDFKYAHLFAKSANIPIYVSRVNATLELTEKQLIDNFESSYCLSDGVIRPGVYWDEAYSTEDYRLSIYNEKPFIRLYGFGGEQYRNGERIPLKSNRKLKSWIRWEMMYKYTGRYFNNDNEARLIENRIETNLIKQFGSRKINLNLHNYKKYIKLVQSPSYRSLQASMENRLGFCINPFLDVQLSDPAEFAIPFLGQSLDFQLSMIRKLSPFLAAVPNGYGFDFTKGEPLQYKIGSILWQNSPIILKYKLYAEYKNHYFSDYIFQLKKRNGIVEDMLIEIEKMKLPLNMDKHLLVRSRSKLVLNLGYFILRNSSKIIY